MTAIDWDALARALEYPAAGPARLQEDYVRTFDLDPACSLDMGWHLFGERPERGAFMAALRADLAAAGVAEDGNLPDYLPTLVRLMGRTDAQAAAALAAVLAPAVAPLLEHVKARQTSFADALAAVAGALEHARLQETRP